MARFGLMGVVAALAVVGPWASLRAFADVPVSVELEVSRQDFIARAVVNEVLPPVGGRSAARLKVVEMLKGEPAESVDVLWPRGTAKWPAPAAGGEFLICGGELSKRRGQDAVIWVALDMPDGGIMVAGRPVGGSAMDRESRELITLRLDRLRTRGQAMAAVRRAAAETPVGLSAEDRNLGMCLPMPSRFRRAGIGDGVILPLDSRTEATARQWALSDEPDVRFMAVRPLHRFRNDQNEALLKQMLDDTAVLYGEHGSGKWAEGKYAIRETAHECLTEWGVKVARPVMQGPVLRHEAVRWRVVKMAGAGLAAWVVLGAMLGAWRGGRGRRILASVRGSVLAGSIALAAGVALLCWRSGKVVDELVWSRGTTRHELSSYAGSVQYIELARWPKAAPAEYGRFELGRTGDLWSEAALAPTSAEGRAGFRRTAGAVKGPDDAVHEYRLARVPYWCLAVVLLSVPAVRVLAGLRRKVRARRGCCAVCGYDLRASVGRCPECGTGIA